MEKGLFEKAFNDNLNKNFEKYSKYFDFKLFVLTDLGTVIFEINKCLILELNRAAITLTNFLLERGLKLALIYNEAGVGPKPVENWTEIFSGPSKKYNIINLSTSIDQCRKVGLLTQVEKDYLYDTIRVLMRNGFAHADPSQIIKNIPDETPVFVGRLDNPGEIQKINLDQKVIPTFQSLQMDNFAKEIASKYFDSIYNLMINIDGRLKSKE
jgi:hypothetical protein